MLLVWPEAITDLDAPEFMLIRRPVDDAHFPAAQLLQIAAQRARAVAAESWSLSSIRKLSLCKAIWFCLCGFRPRKSLIPS